MLLWLASALSACGQVQYFDNFEQFSSGTTLSDGYIYSPSSGPAGALAKISRRATTTVTMTNVAGSIRALWYCPVNSDTSAFNDYRAIFATPQSNQVLSLTWQLRVDASKPGTVGGVVVQLPLADTDESTVIAFNDSGQIYAVTNVFTSLSDLVTIGSWTSLVATIMTNQMIMNYPARTITLSVNGNLIATVPMRPDLTNYVDHITFEFVEDTAYGSAGNTFALDEIKVGLASLQPTLGPFEWAKRVASTVNQDTELSIGMTLDSQGNVYERGGSTARTTLVAWFCPIGAREDSTFS